jgi:hypothetical protein
MDGRQYQARQPGRPPFWDAVASKESHEMFRRIVLAFTFAAALGAAGFGMASDAKAHGGGCGYGNYNSNYGGGYAAFNGYRGVYYGGYPTYGPSYFATGYTCVPPVVYYPNVRRHNHHHDHRDHGGITFAIGF